MTLLGQIRRTAALAALGLATALCGARAEVSEVRISKGYGILYLPLIVMQGKRLFEEQAKKSGLGDVKATWLLFDGGNVINDAMLAGTLDVAGTGAPGFITLWSKAKGSRAEVVGVSGLSATSLWLNSNRPGMMSLRDVGPGDKIRRCRASRRRCRRWCCRWRPAKEFGPENWAKLDPMTVPGCLIRTRSAPSSPAAPRSRRTSPRRPSPTSSSTIPESTGS